MARGWRDVQRGSEFGNGILATDETDKTRMEGNWQRNNGQGNRGRMLTTEHTEQTKACTEGEEVRLMRVRSMGMSASRSQRLKAADFVRGIRVKGMKTGSFFDSLFHELKRRGGQFEGSLSP
jgi:hypothetical protein